MDETTTRGGVGWGPLSVEAGLLEEVAAACAEGSADFAHLAAPLRVVVPSEALRAHLSSRLLERVGSAVLGLKIQTTASAAREVLEAAGETPVEAVLSGIAVRAAARREPALARELDALDDGYAAVVAAANDLFDSGFSAALAETLAEALAEQPPGPHRDRGQALLRVAERVAREFDAETLGHPSLLYVRAAQRLRAEGEAALPSRAVWLHGFSDATGVQLDWLEALRSELAAALWVDLPGGGEWRFGARLRERLGAEVLGAEGPGAGPALEAVAEKSTHSDREAEARAAVEWARVQIEAGAVPERVGIVARDLATHRLALRRHFDRLGVPFSGAGERGGALPLARRLEACWSLVERGAALPIERWLEARGDLSLSERADLRDACAALGATRLGELARAEAPVPSQGVRLNAPTGLVVGDDGTPRTAYRRVESRRLRALRDRAGAALRRLESWPAEAPLAERLRDLAELGEALGWSDTGAELQAIEGAFPEPERAGARPISRGDWPRLLRKKLAEAGTDPLGGRGGGVQVLSATEARGQTFDALWLLGMERGVFPRPVSEDPLLPDSLRIALRVVLPDLPVKGEGRDEERFLFAQLQAATPRLHVSRALRNESGRSVQASPLFESLDASRQDFESVAAQRLDTQDALVDAMASARGEVGLAATDCLPAARARLTVLAELESRRRGVGPYLGVVGPARAALDPRRAAPFVTLLEATARCPWQAFLRRLLRVSPLPDPHGPLPEASDNRVLGNAVHGALEALCEPGNAESRWPESAPAAAIEAATARALRKEGIVLPGYEVALARRVAPYVEVARRLDAVSDWSVEGVEVRESTRLSDASGASRTLRFKADREESREGVRRFTDWKAGNLKLKQGGADARSNALRKMVATGELLQGHAYASTGAVGRYLFLLPDADEALREVEVEAEGPQREAFDASVSVLLDSLEAGAFPPRLRHANRDDEPNPCRSCEVKQACLRGDSGVRRRLADWGEAEAPHGDLDRAGLALWWIEVER